jgi:hypothetical protein
VMARRRCGIALQIYKNGRNLTTATRALACLSIFLNIKVRL